MDPTLLLAVLAAVAFAALWVREIRRHRATRLARAALRERLEAAQQQSAQTAERKLWLETSGLASQEMLIALDHQLRVRGVNPAARQVLGPPPAEGTLISYVRSLDLEDLVRESLESGTGAVLERIVRFGRRPFLARAVCTPQGIGISLADIAERERLGRARQDMVANLSHELRTPLTALRLLADTLQVPAGQDPSTARELASKISAEVDTLSQMTQEMLDLAAIESGRQVIRLVPTRLADVVARAFDGHADQARRQGVTIRVEVPADLEVLADPSQAVRAVGNVLHNAVKFSPAGGEVEIRSLLDESESVTLTVADEGPGIPPEELERIFERFFRGDRSRGTPGTGLGLAIVRHILRAHGGEAWAEDRQPPRRGAVLSLRFQAAREPIRFLPD